jgi:hypothetical protein
MDVASFITTITVFYYMIYYFLWSGYEDPVDKSHTAAYTILMNFTRCMAAVCLAIVFLAGLWAAIEWAIITTPMLNTKLLLYFRDTPWNWDLTRLVSITGVGSYVFCAMIYYALKTTSPGFLDESVESLQVWAVWLQERMYDLQDWLGEIPSRVIRRLYGAARSLVIMALTFGAVLGMLLVRVGLAEEDRLVAVAFGSPPREGPRPGHEGEVGEVLFEREVSLSLECFCLFVQKRVVSCPEISWCHLDM